MVAPLLILNQFSNFLTIRFSSKFAAKYLLQIPPHLICVATLPCETLTSENERQLQTNTVINNKLLRYASYIFKVWWDFSNQERFIAESAIEFF